MFWYEGIGMRPLEEDDLEDIRALRNDPSTWMNLTFVGQISKTQQKEWFHRICTAKDQAYFAVFKELKEFPTSTTGDLIGLVRFDLMDGIHRTVRAGADIVPSERKKGLGTLTLKMVLNFCFLHWQMHKVWLCVLENNDIAKRLYENVGFKEDGLLRDHVYRNGKYLDYIIMSLLEDEYRKLKQ